MCSGSLPAIRKDDARPGPQGADAAVAMMSKPRFSQRNYNDIPLDERAIDRGVPNRQIDLKDFSGRGRCASPQPNEIVQHLRAK
jgi:hypothetical protein